MPSPIIQLDNIVKKFNSFKALDHLSLQIEAGEVFGFLGPNGAGKTTAIRILLNLLHPDGGTAAVLGKNVFKNSYFIRTNCGYLPGDFTPYGQLTGSQFLKLFANYRKINLTSVFDFYEKFEIKKRDLEKKVKHLSQGNRQKLGIIQAFFHQPKLVVLDEPTTALDPIMQSRLYDLIREYRNNGGTVFFSSHNLSEVEAICSRVGIIKNGKLITEEPIWSLKKKCLRKLKITLKESQEMPRLKCAKLVEQHGRFCEFIIESDMPLLLKELSGYEFTDITLPEPDLEGIFMGYYQSENNV